MGGLGSIPGLGISPGGGHGNPLWYSCLENPTDGGAWWATIHRSQRGAGNTTVNKINKVRPNRDCISFGNVDYIDNNKLIKKYISTSES